MRVVDLFAGAGGLSLGFSKSDFEVVAAYDFWNLAVECYQKNFNHPVFEFNLMDVPKAVDHISQWKPDMIIGGPPCQDFSDAGKRTEGHRASLTMSFANIISSIRPKWFVMENVGPAMKSSAFTGAQKIFKKAGYGLSNKVLNASLCGVPQKRRRFFCVGLLGARDNFLDSIIEEGLSKEPMTVRDYIGKEFGIKYYYRHPRNYNRRGIFSIDEPAPTVRGVNRPVPKGYPGHHGDPVRVSSKIRALTTLERARLQTFPEKFIWVGSKTNLEQMIGNAVPVKLAEFVARSIKTYSDNGCCEKVV